MVMSGASYRVYQRQVELVGEVAGLSSILRRLIDAVESGSEFDAEFLCHEGRRYLREVEDAAEVFKNGG